MSKTIKILIVEDELIDQKLIKRAINNSGIISEVHIVSNAHSAFEIVDAHSFDCIFIDYVLPELNGIEVVKKLTEMNVKAAMIVITSQTDEQLADLAIAAGATNYLTKSLISPEGISLIIRNSLSIKQIQFELEEAKNRAEKAVRVKEEFLSNMSHEIRTPLNAIIGFNDLLKQSPLNQEQEKYIEIVNAASRNLMVIINDILDISKMESGIIELENLPITIKEIAENVINLQSEKAKEKGLKLLLSIGDGVPESVLGDSTRISQILINLIGNALKFTNKGFVELIISETTRKDNETLLKFSVIDTGIGIEKDQLENIFERFTQAESSTTRVYGGTGLGLNICQKLVELHNGKIELKSEIGKGSEFSFEIQFLIPSSEQLKLKDNNFNVNKLDIDNKKGLVGTSILIVEDNEHNQLLATAYLKKHGASVEIAENGSIAIEKLKNQAYDLILMDLEMPVLDGCAATKIIREDLKLKTPIIACSAHPLIGQRQKCFDKGMNGMLSKPYSEELLLNEISHLIKTTPTFINKEAKIKKEATFEHKNATFEAVDDFKEILAATEKENGKEFIDMMLEVYHRRIPSDINTLEEALQKQDVNSIKFKAHLLTGSLSSLNFDIGCNLAKSLEKTATTNDFEAIKPKTILLINYLKKSLQVLK